MKRIRALPAFFISCGAVAFLAASLSTQYWITSDAVKTDVEVDNNMDPRTTEGTKYKGELHFGLFRGTKWVDNGAGVRHGKLTIACSPKDGVCMYSDQETVEERTQQLQENLFLDKQEQGSNETAKIDNPHLLSFGVWTFTVVTVAISLFFGLIAAIFSVVNAVITPVEFITGYQGLFVWSGLGGFSALLAVCSWAALYHSTLKNNIMNKEEMKTWKSEGMTAFAYSYWFVLIAMFLYCINIVVLALFIKQPWKQEQTQPTQSKNPEGAIMLY